MPLSRNRAKCKALVQTRAGKKNPSSLNSYSPQKTVTAVPEQWQHTQGSKTVTSKTWLYQQEKAVPARAPARETPNSKGGTSKYLDSKGDTSTYLQTETKGDLWQAAAGWKRPLRVSGSRSLER
jgi:hypothetical protein